MLKKKLKGVEIKFPKKDYYQRFLYTA